MKIDDWCLEAVNCGQPTEAQYQRGQVLFNYEAGGVGCAYCHKADGSGDPAQGAPPNLGKRAGDIKSITFAKDAMDLLRDTMTDADFDAAAAYLQYLASASVQP